MRRRTVWVWWIFRHRIQHVERHREAVGNWFIFHEHTLTLHNANRMCSGYIFQLNFDHSLGFFVEKKKRAFLWNLLWNSINELFCERKRSDYRINGSNIPLIVWRNFSRGFRRKGWYPLMKRNFLEIDSTNKQSSCVEEKPMLDFAEEITSYFVYIEPKYELFFVDFFLVFQLFCFS